MSPLRRSIALSFWKLAASGALPARWFLPTLPPASMRTAHVAPLHLEIVSHCWQYSHLLVHQLASLVLHPPERGRLTMTVCFSPEDRDTVSLLDHVGAQRVPRVDWNWQAMSRETLFRRSIGRNRVALASRADWIWFTDCDLLFGDGCLDQLQTLLEGRREALVYPERERVTTLLTDEDPLLCSPGKNWSLTMPDTTGFVEHRVERATGPLQITHGDVARAVGYCRDIAVYQAPEPHFAKCHEDRVFRWLLRTQGVPIALEGVYRIRHASKGRYRDGSDARLRQGLRAWQERLRS